MIHSELKWQEQMRLVCTLYNWNMVIIQITVPALIHSTNISRISSMVKIHDFIFTNLIKLLLKDPKKDIEVVGNS